MIDQWKEETGYGFSLYSTPSENLCDRFCRLDTAEFGVVPGVTDKGYYTNSFHLDVEKKVNPYDKIDLDADGLLEPARLLATKRVVVKRPDYAPPLANVATPNAVVTKGHRFDIYAGTPV